METKSTIEANKGIYTEKDKPFFITCAGGLTAISVVILQAFFSVGKLDVPAFISVFALAIALPMLVGCIVVFTFSRRNFHSLLKDTWSAALFVFGSFGALIGMGAALYHVSWIACVLFAMSTLVSLTIYKSIFS